MIEVGRSVAKYFGTILMVMVSALEPTIPFAIILFFATILDCISAFDLNRRLRKQGYSADGKFKSIHAQRILGTFLKSYLVIIILHWVDTIILSGIGYMNLSNVAAAIFCFIQLWSILENASSANGARWAKILQKVMVSKVSRHLDIDEKLFDELKNTSDDKKEK